MTRNFRLQAVLAICVFLFIGFSFALVRPGLPDYRSYVSFSADADGTKALRELITRSGMQAEEWRLTPDRLPDRGQDGSRQLYLAIEPEGMTEQAEKELERWASKYGNDMVILDSMPFTLNAWVTEAVETPESAAGSDAKPAVVTAVGDGEELVYEAAAESEFRLTGVPEDEVLLRDSLGVIAARRQAGEGSITLAVVPEWAQNGTVLQGEQFELLWSLFGGTREGRVIYIDEYHHGYSDAPGLSQVYPPWLLAAFGQAAVACAFWLWMKGKRFGPALTPREFRVRRSDETLLAVAGWYRRGKLTRESLSYRVAHLKHSLAGRGATMAADAGEGEILAAVKQALGSKTPAGLPDVLRRWGQTDAEGAGYSEKQWLADSAVLDETVRALEEAN